MAEGSVDSSPASPAVNRGRPERQLGNTDKPVVSACFTRGCLLAADSVWPVTLKVTPTIDSDRLLMDQGAGTARLASARARGRHFRTSMRRNAGMGRIPTW